MNVHVGSQIQSDSSPRAVGRFGIILSDPLGDLLVATSRDFLSHCNEVSIHTNGQNVTIGERPKRYFPTDINPTSALNLLGWFAPSETIQLGDSFTDVRDILSMQNTFMQDVVIVEDNQEVRRGFVSKVDCFAEFQMPNNGPTQLIDGLIQVTNNSASEAFAVEGSGGALVTTLDGALVGLVVGLLEDGALVAPLNELCEQESLSVASTSEIEIHNSSLGLTPQTTITQNDVPNPILKIHEIMGAELTDEIPVRKVVTDWLCVGWNDVVTDQATHAFRPHAQYFKNVDHDLYTLDEAFTLFVEKELGWGDRRSVSLLDELEDAYLDFVEIVNTDEEVAFTDSDGEIEGSHQRVMRDGEVEDAA